MYLLCNHYKEFPLIFPIPSIPEFIPSFPNWPVSLIPEFYPYYRIPEFYPPHIILEFASFPRFALSCPRKRLKWTFLRVWKAALGFLLRPSMSFRRGQISLCL